MTSVVVFGGYGVFGSLIARELAQSGLRVTVAGRNSEKAQDMAGRIGFGGLGLRGLVADVASKESCRSVLQGHNIAVHCAGPFAGAGPELLDACLETGCHYVDIADDRGYAALVRSYGARFHERKLAAVYGCSSLPGISGALALAAHSGQEGGLKEVRITLFIGNKNPKGEAAINSVARILGVKIQAPQGMISGFPKHFESPEYDLFPEILPVKSVTVKASFEMPVANLLFKALALLPVHYGPGTAKALKFLSRPFKNFGHSGGAVTVELFYKDGSIRRARLTAPEGGQRMAILPCVYSVQALAQKSARASGAMTAYEFLGAETLLKRLASDGAELSSNL